MKFFLNELSLHGQYSSRYDFLASLREILKCKQSINKSGFALYCSYVVFQRVVFHNTLFKQAVISTHNKDIIRLVMLWISKEGPFWDDPSFRLHTQDDYLECEDQIVTDFAIGEAAFQIMSGLDSCAISFNPSSFQYTPVIVTWHSENGHASTDVPNKWELNTIVDLLQQLQPVMQSWEQFVGRVRAEFENLYFLDSFMERLMGESFNLTVAERAICLLKILNKLKICFDNLGNRTTEGHEITENYFQGDEAVFSDESATNKNDFQQQLTFRGPNNLELFCPYHGKIRHLNFRLHFSWPVRRDQPLYVAYLGPKITKR